MRLSMEGQPFLLHLALWACALVFLVSFFIALYANILVLRKTGALVDRAEDQALSWGERAGRKTSNLNRFFVASEFRSLRRLCFSAWAGAIGSFGFLLLLLAAFGERS